jgi:hypothetical protein
MIIICYQSTFHHILDKVLMWSLATKNLRTWSIKTLHGSTRSTRCVVMFPTHWAGCGLWRTSVETRRKLVTSLIVPQFLYCDIIFCESSMRLREKLKFAFNSSARYIYSTSRFRHISPYANQILGVPLDTYYSFRVCCNVPMHTCTPLHISTTCYLNKHTLEILYHRVILWGIGQNWTRVHQNPWNLTIWFIIQYHKTRIFLFRPKNFFCRFYEFLKNFGLAQKKIVKSRYWL